MNTTTTTTKTPAAIRGGAIILLIAAFLASACTRRVQVITATDHGKPAAFEIWERRPFGSWKIAAQWEIADTTTIENAAR